MTDPLEQSLAAGGPHHLLHQLVGNWQGTTCTWFEPGQLGDESEWQGSIKPFLDGKFVLHEYQGAMGGEALHGYCLFGYNQTTEQYEAAWVDSFHTGTAIMHLIGEAVPGGFSVVGSWAVSKQERWGWRTTVRIVDADHITITAYNIAPDGQEYKGVETVYQRRTG